MKTLWIVLGTVLLVGAATLFRPPVLRSAEEPSRTVDASPPDTAATVVVAGGCFWCVEADLEKLDAVYEAVSGYAGGRTKNPTYKSYARGGHREVVRVAYNPDEIDLFPLLVYFLKHIDPTDGRGSFGDRGVGYSPAIYHRTPQQKAEAERALAYIRRQEVFEEELQVPVLELDAFWKAEDYHQDYYKKSALRYNFYRRASGRDRFIKKHWGDRADALPAAGPESGN